jgi:two-component system, sensor histidine kinase and response regulator
MSARIIVVDDNRWVRETLPALLDDEGYRVEVAENGEDAFRRVCREPVDLVLTDVSMPEVDGLELIRLMRADPFFRTVPIIAMTAYGGRRLEEARQAGADACFEKPLQHEVLLTTITGLLKRSAAPPQTTRP